MPDPEPGGGHEAACISWCAGRSAALRRCGLRSTNEQFIIQPCLPVEDATMIIDTHTHVWSFPSYRDLSQHIKTTEDLIAFRTRYPELYHCSLTEPSVDNSDALIADMDKNDVALTLVQA